MPHSLYKRKLLGNPPQSKIFSQKASPTEFKIILYNYGPDFFNEFEIEKFSDCIPHFENPDLTWLSIVGPPPKEFLEQMQNHLKLHSLLIEDLSSEQRPKIEPYDNVLYVVARSLNYDSEKIIIENEQVSLLLGDRYFISFQQKEHEICPYIKKRLLSKTKKIKNLSSDYLLYIFLDILVDNYFVSMEKIAEIIDRLEEDLIENPTTSILKNIHILKREVILMRKSIWPLREVTSKLHRDDFDWITPNISLYLRDLYDHTVQVADTVETFRDMIAGTLDLYLSNVGQKANEVMKVLTVAATIFSPAIFLTGFWGMNFKNMPELNWAWGYPAALVFMLSTIGMMIYFFKKKKWI